MERSKAWRRFMSRPAWGCILAFGCAGGFGFLGCICPPDSPAGPDTAAITTVVKDVYLSEGEQRIIFVDLDAGDAEEEAALAEAREQLATELGVQVRPESDAAYFHPDLPFFTPCLAETGEAGIAVRLGRFRVGDDGRLSVTVFWSRSCDERAEIDYILDRQEETWVIVGRNVRPDLIGCI